MGLNTKLKFNLDLKEINKNDEKKLYKELTILFKKYGFILNFNKTTYSVKIR